MALGFFESSSDPSQPDSFEAIQRKRKLVEAMLAQGLDTSPVQHWTQGLARLANAGVGAWKESKLDQQEKDSGSQFSQKLLDAMTGGSSSPSSPSAASSPMPSQAMASDGLPAPTPPGNIPSSYRDAIAAIESKGSGDYAATGPVTNRGDRAFGRYQVMGANIPEWTKAALGKPMSPQEFLASPEAQDKVFDHRFGSYVQKYGNPQDAASAWFTGRPLAQGANSRDVLGTSGSAYVDKFTRALGQQPAGAAQAIAQAAPQQGSPAMAYAPTGAQPMSQPDPAALSPEMLQDYARRQGMTPQDPAGGAALGGTPKPADMPAPAATPAGGAPMGRIDRPGDQLIKLGPNGELPPGAEKLLGAMEGSPEAAAMQRSQPGAPAASVDKSKMLLMMAMDPRYSPQQRQMAMQVASTLQAQDKPMVLQEGASLVKPDGRGGYTTIAGGGGKPTDAIRNYQYYVQQESAAGRAPKNMDQWQTDQKKAGATSIGIDTKGQAGMQTKAIEGFDTAIKAGTDANRRIASYGQMTEAMKGFTPGATAEGRMKAKSILKDMGLIEGTDVPDAEAFKRVQRQLEIQATPKGQGQITENERVLIREMIPQIGNSPEGIAKIIGQLKQLDDYDLKVAEIYRNNARKNGGAPNFLDVSDEIAALGPPMTDAQMGALKSTLGQKGATPAQPGGQRKTIGGKTYEQRNGQWYEAN